MTTGSSMQAMTFVVPPQIRHVSTSISPKTPTVGENPLQALRPGHGHMTPNRCLLVLASCVLWLATLAPLRRCHQRTVLAMGCKHTVKTCQIDSGPGHQGGLACSPIEGFFNSGQCLQREYLTTSLRSHRDAIRNGMPLQLIYWFFI